MGLPLAIEFSKADFPVTGLDIDQKQIDLLSEGKSYIKHIPRENIDFMNQEGGFRGSADFSLFLQLKKWLLI